LLLGLAKVDHAAVNRADPEGVISNVYVTLDLSQVYPDDVAALDVVHFLGYLDLGGRLRGR
jgi:hypothetical protein